MVLFYHAIKTI